MPPAAYGSDANGNTTARGTDTFSYDQADRMLSAAIGGVTSQFAYDGDGRRARKTVGSTITDYLTAGGSLLDDGTRRYVGGLGGVGYSEDGSGKVEVFHGDVLGSVRSLTDALGTGGAMLGISDTYGFDEFGIPGARQGTSTQPFGFGGAFGDSETGLLGGYDPATGRGFPGLPLDVLPFGCRIIIWPPGIVCDPPGIPGQPPGTPTPPPSTWPAPPTPRELPPRQKQIAPGCPAEVGDRVRQIISGKVIQVRGPGHDHLGEDECHVNASVSPGWNWHIYWEEAGFVARLGTLGLYLGPEAYSAAVETINHLAQFFPDIRDKDRLDREMRGSLYDALDDLYHYQVGAWPT